MLRRLRKILSILLVLTLIIPGFAFADNSGSLSPQQEELFQKVIENFGTEPVGKIDRENPNEIFKDDEEVRIIVELESSPSIVYATESNLSYREMSRKEIDSIESKIEVEQENVKKNILSKNINMQFINNFKIAFNGFSGKVKYEDIKVIEKLPSVKNVYIANEYERPEIKPDMDTSNDMIGSQLTWNLEGYKGEGMVIAIIDTGIDPSHRDMVLSEETVPALTREMVEEMDLLGKFYTDKVPYGYNYYDLNDEIRDLGPSASMHGMHVAGTAGANGDPENGGIKGVAPESQLLAMKVFSNDPIYATTFSDIYLVAIDEAIKLGADVLNMSLGSTAGFYIPESAENVALTNATNNGIVCSVSAGNSGHLTYGWESFDPTYQGYPWKQNPDIGVVGSPGLNKDTIQVASINNTHQKVNSLVYEKDGEEYSIPMAIAGDIDPSTALPGPQEFVDCGDGSPEYFTEEVVGKVALVVRGGSTAPFVDKIQNAQDAGAAAIIVRNHESGGEELINMQTPEEHTIPAVFIGYTDGMTLLELDNKEITFTDDLIGAPNPKAYTMADYSSWGTTPSLELKPEITAPGSYIYSTLNDDKYGTMSGTSMAAPHVAGGSALVMQYIKEHELYSNLSLEEQARLAKALLMNTANVLIQDVYGDFEYPYSPRLQGAGLMNLYGAVTTPVRVVNTETNEAKVELKDFEDTEFTMSFTAINDTDTDATYNVDVYVLKDYIYPYAGAELNLLSTDYIYDAVIDAPDTITVPANGEIEFEVTVDLSQDDTIYRNMFVEGFVKLIDPNDTNPTLSVPYVGFYGSWDEPAILDNMRFIDQPGTSYFNRSGLLYVDSSGSAYYYGTPDRIYMSPGTLDGFIFGTGNLLPYLSFLRNAEIVNYNILDAEGNKLRTIKTHEYYRKDYVDGGRYQPVAMVQDAWWYGDVNGEILPDGEYFYEIEAKIHYADAEFQSKRIPITIDTVAPVVTDLAYDQETGNISWSVVEESAGIMGFILEINGEEMDASTIAERETEEGKKIYEFNASEYIGIGSNAVSLLAVDNAFNVGMGELTVNLENDYPYIFILEPNLFSILTENEVTVQGYIARYELLESVFVNGEEADIEYFEHIDLPHPDDPNTIIHSGPAYSFTKTLTLEDGYQEVQVEAVSSAGVSGSLTRRFFVDTTAPELDILVTRINPDELTADLEIRMYDNLGSVYLYEGDSQIYQYEEPLVRPDPSEKIFNYTVNLEEGENLFGFTLIDMANHETYKEIVVTDKVITNVQPSENIELAAGEELVVSFNAPTGGEGSFRVFLPFGAMSNAPQGVEMVEESTGFYLGTWTIPSDTLATGLQIEVTYQTANGEIYTEIAEGTLTILGDMDDLPNNTVIFDGEAYDIRYLDADEEVQSKLIQWKEKGNPVYVKLNENTIVNTDGVLVNLELPNRLVYYDRQGNVQVYQKLK